MANNFKAINFAAEPASAGTPYVMYTAAGSTTTVVLGLILANIHTTAVTAEVELVSTTSNRGGANNVANGTSMLVKDVSIPSGSSLEILSGSKVILEAGDKIQIDCSVADKISGTLSVMEITLKNVLRILTIYLLKLVDEEYSTTLQNILLLVH